jgi:hypothetical protein
MYIAYLSKAGATSDKKYTVQVIDEQTGRKRTISFGARGYEDFTIHRDQERRKQYISRHQAREDWNDPFTAGFWSANLLWNKPTIEASMRDISRRFRVQFKS